MKMKKLFLGVSFFSLLVLGACEKGIPNIDKTDYFKEYTFGERATQKQINAINDGVINGANTLSWVSIRTESYSKANLAESYDTSDNKIEIMEDNTNKDLLVMKTIGAATSERKSGGITFKQTEKREVLEWESSGYTYTSVKQTINNKEPEKQVDVSGVSGTTSSKDRKMSAIKRLLGVDSASNYYAKDDGTFVCVADSSIQRSVKATQWGDSTKEYIKESKLQSIFFVDGEYRLTSFYRYSEESTNRDELTGEWYDSARLVSYSYTSTEYHYGNRTLVDVGDLTKSVSTKSTNR